MSLSTSNIFSALDTKKKKKSSSKSKESGDKKKKHSSKSEKAAEVEPTPVAQPQQLSISNWADEDDDFENDIAALPEGWDEAPQVSTGNGLDEDANAEEAESDEEAQKAAIEQALGIEVDRTGEEDEDEEEEEEDEDDQTAGEETGSVADSSAGPKPASEGQRAEPKPAAQPERQLSKKEKKAKEMEELARTLEELGIQNVAPDQEPAGQTESSKRKKKKEKAKNGDKDLTTADSTEANGVTEEGSQQPAAAESAPEATEDPSAAEPEELVDPKEVRKRLAAAKAKSKKSGAAAAALAEAQARAKKKGKGKDTGHYNQAPTR